MNPVSGAVSGDLGLKRKPDNENRILVVCCMVGIFALEKLPAAIQAEDEKTSV